MNFATPLSNKRENNWVNCWELYVRGKIPIPSTRYEDANMTISSQSIAIKANMAIAGSTTSGLPHVKTQVSPNAQPPSKIKLAFNRWGEDMVSSSVKALAAQKKILSIIAINEESDCWEAGNKPNTPVSVRLGDEYAGSVSHYRYAYVAFNRALIAEGLQINHKCDNRRCCNPVHLYAGTQSQNIQDMYDRGRDVIPRGDDHPWSTKLSSDKVVEIRVRIANGESHKIVGKDYGVTGAQVSAITTGAKWKSAGGPITVRNTGVSDEQAHIVLDLYEGGTKPTPISILTGLKINQVKDIVRGRMKAKLFRARYGS